MDTEMINDKVSQGIMLISAEKYDAAKKVFEEIISEAPRTLEAYIHLGNACANLEQYSEAIEAFKKALLVDPNYAEAYFSRTLPFFVNIRTNNYNIVFFNST